MKKLVLNCFFCILPFVGYNQDLSRGLTAEVRNEVRRIWVFDTCGEKGKRDSLIRGLLQETTFIGLDRTDIEDIFGKPDNSVTDEGQLYYSYVLWGTIDSETHGCKCGTLYTASTLNARMSIYTGVVDYFRIEEE